MCRFRLLAMCAVLTVVGAAASPVCAEAAEEGERFAWDASKEPDWYLSIAGITESFGGGDESVFMTIVQAEVPNEEPGWTWVWEFVGYGVDQSGPDAWGAGANLLARWYPDFEKNGSMGWFAEGGVGIVEFTHRVPSPQGTHFNFTIHGSMGWRAQLNEQTSFQIGPRYFHISNAGHRGQNRNRSVDGFGAFATFKIDF